MTRTPLSTSWRPTRPARASASESFTTGTLPAITAGTSDGSARPAAFGLIHDAAPDTVTQNMHLRLPFADLMGVGHVPAALQPVPKLVTDHLVAHGAGRAVPVIRSQKVCLDSCSRQFAPCDLSLRKLTGTLHIALRMPSVGSCPLFFGCTLVAAFALATHAAPKARWLPSRSEAVGVPTAEASNATKGSSDIARTSLRRPKVTAEPSRFEPPTFCMSLKRPAGSSPPTAPQHLRSH